MSQGKLEQARGKQYKRKAMKTVTTEIRANRPKLVKRDLEGNNKSNLLSTAKITGFRKSLYYIQ